MVSMRTLCVIDGCNNFKNNVFPGYCSKHQHRMDRHGDPHFVKRVHHRHGMTGTSEYRAWRAMIDRCTNPNIRNYKLYGARGISVCDAWMQFDQFLKDMGAKPGAYHSIERMDNNKGYTPENCKWATRTEQQNNRRNSVKVTISGVRDSLPGHARRHGLPVGTVTSRYARGIAIDKLIEPVKESYRGRKRSKYHERT